MTQNIMNYIDIYSNLILNHLLLAENQKGINVIKLSYPPTVQTIITEADGIPFSQLSHKFNNYLSIELGKIAIETDPNRPHIPTYEISLYLMSCDHHLEGKTIDSLYDGTYQLTGNDYLIMSCYAHQNSPANVYPLYASTILSCSLNLSLKKDYDMYRNAMYIVRKTITHFYHEQISRACNSQINMHEMKDTMPLITGEASLQKDENTTPKGLLATMASIIDKGTRQEEQSDVSSSYEDDLDDSNITSDYPEMQSFDQDLQNSTDEFIAEENHSDYYDEESEESEEHPQKSGLFSSLRHLISGK